MQLNSISFDGRAIVMKVTSNKETDNNNDTVNSEVIAKEEPLPSLTKAWNALPAVFCEIMEYDPSYAEGLSITRLAIRRTKQGTRSVILEAKKQLECRHAHLHPMDAPCVQIDESADGESGPIQIDKKLCKALTKAIHESERYLAGERSQTMLNFDEGKAALQATADQGKDLLAGVQ